MENLKASEMTSEMGLNQTAHAFAQQHTHTVAGCVEMSKQNFRRRPNILDLVWKQVPR